MKRTDSYWHNPAMRAAAAVADGWQTYDAIYRPCEWSSDRLAAVRTERLAETVGAARLATQYRAALADAVGSPFDIVGRLPPLEKRVLVERPEMLRTGLLEPTDVIRTRTSGTTGEPVVVEHDERRLSEAFASHLRTLAAYGVEPGYRSLRFTADSRHALVHFDQQPLGGLELCLRVNASKVTPSNARYVFELCRDFRPAVITGQPMEVLLGCTRMVELEEQLPAVSLILTHGDTVDDSTRKALQHTIGAPHCDVYGLQETGKVAWACPQVPGHYHLEEEKVLCEVDGDGLLLLTSLVNRAMVLIRYRPGDGCDGGPARCPCGRASRVLTGLRGRQRGFVADREGRLIAIKPLRLYLESLGLARWQFVQSAPGEARLLLCDPPDPERRREIAHRVQEIADLADVRIETVAVDELLTASGKAPHFRLLVDQRRLAEQLTGGGG